MNLKKTFPHINKYFVFMRIMFGYDNTMLYVYCTKKHIFKYFAHNFRKCLNYNSKFLRE